MGSPFQGGSALSTAAERPRTWDGVASCVLGVVYLGMLAAWVPQYLAWPWWTDLDHFATFAMAWDVGVLPYRDLPTFAASRRVLFVLADRQGLRLGTDRPRLRRRRRGGRRPRARRWPPGAVGGSDGPCRGSSATAPSFVITWAWGFIRSPSADWHSALLATLGLFAAEVVPGRRGRIASALALASALAIRPHVVLLVPAFLLALDESARPTGGPWSLTRPAVVEWGLLVCGLFAARLRAAGRRRDVRRLRAQDSAWPRRGVRITA